MQGLRRIQKGRARDCHLQKTQKTQTEAGVTYGKNRRYRHSKG